MDRLKISQFFKNTTVVRVYKGVLTFVLLLGIGSISIFDCGSIFAVPVVYTLVYVGSSIHLTLLLYFIASIICSFSVQGILFSLLVTMSLLCYYMCSYKLSSRLRLVLYYTMYVLVHILYIVIYFDGMLSVLYLAILCVLSAIYLYVCLGFFTACTHRCFCSSLNSDEYVCGSIVFVTFIVGLLTFSDVLFDICTPICVILILVVSYVFDAKFSLYISAVVGLGYSIYFVSPIYISLYICMSIVCVAFKSRYKVFSVVGTVLVYVLINVYFVDYYMPTIYGIASLVVACLVFQFTPLCVFESIVDVLCCRKPDVILLDVVNRSKQSIRSRLLEISYVFAHMDTAFRQMVKGNMDVLTAKRLVKDDICHNLCMSCAHFKTCVALTDDICGDPLSDVVNIAFEKGKVSVLDIPKGIASRCSVGALCSVVNRSIVDIRGYSDIVKNMDSSKLLIANQLSGMSRLLESLADEVNANITFDTDRERLVLEELSYKNIVCYECVVYEKDRNTIVVSIVISDSDYHKKYIERVISKCCHVRMMVVSVESAESNHTKLITLATAPNFDIVYGEARVGKHGIAVSGDSHTLIKIDECRYMVAICDGMGNGSRASSISSLAISLIENYYKAGFDDETIMSSINKLLMLNESENYSTVDLCVVDLKNNNYSFIKLGASVSFVKTSMSTIEIEGSGLPIGILENIKPHIISRKISEFDTLILCSDGVVDSFGSISLKEYISSLDIINPQTLADTILSKAVSNYGGVPLDDMTVVAVRIYPV